MARERASLFSAIERRFPWDSDVHRQLRERTYEVCCAYLEAGLGDTNAEQRLCEKGAYGFPEQMAEVLAAQLLLSARLRPIRRPAAPDFLLEHEDRRIWIEVVCPRPEGVPAEWINPPELPFATYFPWPSILLRWTHGLLEKTRKLVGNSDRQVEGYLQKGVVSSNDIYVVAINGRQLRGAFRQLNGISGYPFAVEAAFGVGPLEVVFDRETLQRKSSGLSQRDFQSKESGRPVPVKVFADPTCREVSAIWAMDIDESVLIGGYVDCCVVHNPNAANRLPVGLLPAQTEYVATRVADGYDLKEVAGQLAEGASIGMTSTYPPPGLLP